MMRVSPVNEKIITTDKKKGKWINAYPTRAVKITKCGDSNYWPIIDICKCI